MDFIGQKGPSSKTHLVFLDLLILGLQIVCLGIQSVKRKAKDAAAETGVGSRTGNALNVTGSQSSVTGLAAAATTQTLDFEERGLHGSDHQAVDIELQNLNPEGARVESTSSIPRAEQDEDEDDQERESLLAAHTAPRSDSHLFDAFNSGEVIIADLDLQRVAREQFIVDSQQSASTQDGRSTAANAFTASFSGTGLNFRMRIGNRILGI